MHRSLRPLLTSYRAVCETSQLIDFWDPYWLGTDIAVNGDNVKALARAMKAIDRMSFGMTSLAASLEGRPSWRASMQNVTPRKLFVF